MIDYIAKRPNILLKPIRLSVFSIFLAFPILPNLYILYILSVNRNELHYLPLYRKF